MPQNDKFYEYKFRKFTPSTDSKSKKVNQNSQFFLAKGVEVENLFVFFFIKTKSLGTDDPTRRDLPK